MIYVPLPQSGVIEIILQIRSECYFICVRWMYRIGQVGGIQQRSFYRYPTFPHTYNTGHNNHYKVSSTEHEESSKGGHQIFIFRYLLCYLKRNSLISKNSLIKFTINI